MTPEEVATSSGDPLHEDYLLLRRLDEGAKEWGPAIPALEHYAQLVAQCSLRYPYLVFDFDHTLAVEGVLYSGLAEELRVLHTNGYRLYVCSYNPLAERLLGEQGCGDLIQAYLPIPTLDKGEAIRDYCWVHDLHLHLVRGSPRLDGGVVTGDH
jgi:hypothetical protein